MIFLVHGYHHDPDTPNHDPNRAGGQFDIWERILEERAVRRFAWYSAIQGRWRDVWSAWRKGYRTTYGWAYGDLAVAASRRLLREVEEAGEPVDILCHSLGARVALGAVGLNPRCFRRVLIMNGAETLSEAKQVFVKAPQVQFLNLGAKADDVVRLAGGLFAPSIGYDACLANGLGEWRQGNVGEVILDDPETRGFYLGRCGWDLRGDNPRSAGDHSYSFLWPGNWPLIQSFLDGEVTGTEKAGLGPRLSFSSMAAGQD